MREEQSNVQNNNFETTAFPTKYVTYIQPWNACIDSSVGKNNVGKYCCTVTRKSFAKAKGVYVN